MYTIHEGKVTAGFQFASGQAVGRIDHPSPFPSSTLRMQAPIFKERGLDLEAEVPGLFWGTVNVRLSGAVALKNPDWTFASVDWTSGTEGVEIPPETFSFVRCCFAFGGCYHSGLIYYPHPETKPTTNEHRYDVLEILTSPVEALLADSPASVICRADAFSLRA